MKFYVLNIIICTVLVSFLMVTLSTAHDYRAGPVPDSLKVLMHSPDKETRAKAYATLEYYTKDDVYIYLEQGINDADMDVVAAALGPLTHCKSRYYERYLELVESKDDRIRELAAIALGRSMSPKRVEPLIKLLDDDVAKIRTYAAEALGFIKDERAREVLFDVMEHDRSTHVRCCAAMALANMKDSRALDTLVTCTSQGLWEYRIRWTRALGQIDSVQMRSTVLSLLDDEDRVVRQAFAREAGRLKMTEAVPKLIHLWRTDQVEARRHYLKALGLIADLRALPLVMEKFKEHGDYLLSRGSMKTEPDDSTEPSIGELLQAASRISGKPFNSRAYYESSYHERLKLIEEWLSWWEENKDAIGQ